MKIPKGALGRICRKKSGGIPEKIVAVFVKDSFKNHPVEYVEESRWNSASIVASSVGIIEKVSKTPSKNYLRNLWSIFEFGNLIIFFWIDSYPGYEGKNIVQRTGNRLTRYISLTTCCFSINYLRNITRRCP